MPAPRRPQGQAPAPRRPEVPAPRRSQAAPPTAESALQERLTPRQPVRAFLGLGLEPGRPTGLPPGGRRPASRRGRGVAAVRDRPGRRSSRPGGLPQRRGRAVDRPHAARAAGRWPRRPRPRPSGSASSGGARAPSTWTCCWSARRQVDEPDLIVPHPGCGRGASCWSPWPIWPPNWCSATSPPTLPEGYGQPVTL